MSPLDLSEMEEVEGGRSSETCWSVGETTMKCRVQIYDDSGRLIMNYAYTVEW